MKYPFLVLCLLCLSAGAQRHFTISGYITEKGSKETLPGVTVYQPGSNNATTTNPYGFYSITLPENDSVMLVYSFVGYSSQSQNLSLHKNTVISIQLPSNNNLQEVEVVTQKHEAISEDVQMSRIDIPIDKIKDIPALLGEKDVLKVLQLMPGVQKGSEGSSGFYVRGGGPDQNLIILDDATVYNAFHLFGFFSLFNGDALKSIELTKGGFPARYGGRLSSVLDMQMKDGNKEKIHGEAGIGILSSRLTLEGPIFKDKCSFLVSARRTYFDALIYPFLPKDEKGGYYFYDLNAKLNYVISDKDRLFVSGYFGKDKFYIKDNSQKDYQSKAGLNWGNATATARWNHLFSNKLFANTSLIFTDYKLNIFESQSDPNSTSSFLYSSGIRDFSIKTGFDFMPNPKHYIKFGVSSTYHQFRPGAVAVKNSFASDYKTAHLTEAFENGIFIEDNWKITPKWRVNGGLRISNFIVQKENYINPEPRASVRYLIKKDLSLKASYALMNQYMHLLSNTGIGLPTDLWVPATKRAPYMQSQQVAIGLAKDFKKGFDVSVEGYYKKMNHVLSYKEGASFLSIEENNVQNVSWEDNVVSGQGWSYGGEVLIRKNTGKITGWIGYTLSWTQMQFDELNFGRKFYARYDRRHDISVVGVYHISKKITLSGTWVYGTGNAITLPLNSYQANGYIAPHGGPDPTPVNQGSGNFVQDYGQQRNAYRMSPYHRLDLGLQVHKKFKRYERTFEFSIYNVYSRQNPFFYYIGRDKSGNQGLMQVSLFPIIPSVSWSWKF